MENILMDRLLGGSKSKLAQIYPEALCRKIAAAFARQIRTDNKEVLEVLDGRRPTEPTENGMQVASLNDAEKYFDCLEEFAEAGAEASRDTDRSR